MGGGWLIFTPVPHLSLLPPPIPLTDNQPRGSVSWFWRFVSNSQQNAVKILGSTVSRLELKTIAADTPHLPAFPNSIEVGNGIGLAWTDAHKMDMPD